jgi:hypothetical protein
VTGWAATNTLRELVQYEADRTDNLTPSLDALALVETALDQFASLHDAVHGPNCGCPAGAALRTVREGTS